MGNDCSLCGHGQKSAPLSKKNPGKQYAAADYHPNYYTPTPKEGQKEGENTGMFGVGAISQMLMAMEELNRPEEQTGWDTYNSARALAWKTGTSYGFKDAWAIGLTATHIVGVWIGNADGEGRPELTGAKAAAPLMFDILELLLQEKTFPLSYYSRNLRVCLQSGYKAGPWCEESQYQAMPEVAEKPGVCPYHQLLHLNAEATFQGNSSCYPPSRMQQKSWFVLHPAQAWYFKQYQSSYVTPPEMLASCADHVAGEKSFMELIYPRNYTSLYIPTELDGSAGAAVFEVAHRNPGAEIYWHLDEQYLGKTTRKHQFALHPAKGKHTLHLLDEKGRALQLSFEVISERRTMQD